MKIEINDQQPLDEISKELERLGYRKLHRSRNPCVVYTGTNGGYGSYINTTMDEPNTTLTELKNME